MKKNNLSASVSLTASLAVAFVCAAGCAKKNNSDKTLPPPGEGTPAIATKSATATNANAAADATFNSAPVVAEKAPAITNPPAAATTVTAPATPAPAPTAPAVKRTKIVEMPATTPVAPTNFYSGDLATNSCCLMPTTAENYYFRIRGGYEHTSHGDNSDTFYLGIKFYANGGDLRERAGKNAWLVPDADLEFSHQGLPKPDFGSAEGSDEGVQLRANLFWPWAHWTTRIMSRTNSLCPLSQPLELGFGPTLNIGFDKLFDHTDARLNRYFGARMTINREGFIEVTGGATDGLEGTRAQVLTELPVFTSRSQDVRYVVRGLWNTGDNRSPDVFQAALFVEMPLDFIAQPDCWSDLNPFKK